MEIPPIKIKKKTTLVQAHIEKDLVDAVALERNKRGMNIKDFLEWAMISFLKETNPSELKKLGLK